LFLLFRSAFKDLVLVAARILAVVVILFGIMMARSAMRALNGRCGFQSLAPLHTRAGSDLLERRIGSGYGVYLLLTAV